MISAVISQIDDDGDNMSLDDPSEPLGPAKVEVGRRGEMERLEHFDVKDDVDESEAYGYQIIDAKWGRAKQGQCSAMQNCSPTVRDDSTCRPLHWHTRHDDGASSDVKPRR